MALAVTTAALLWHLTANATYGDYQHAVTNETSLISYYTFDESDAQDSRGLHPGTLQGTTSFFTRDIKFGKGLFLNGTGRVNLGTVDGFHFLDLTGSVEAWILPLWPETFSAYNPCLIADRNGEVRWSIHMNKDRGAVGMWNGSTYNEMSIPNASTGWHHFVVVFDNGNVTMYWDGVSIGTIFQSLGGGNASTQVGSSAAGSNAEGWMGVVDEVAFYADALTPEAVLAHYRAFFAGTRPVITTQPQGGTYLAGVPLELSVKATGPSLTYQWYKDSAALAGKTDSKLSLASLATNDAGTYSVTVTNPAGKTPSVEVSVAIAATVPEALRRYQAAISNETGLISYYKFDHLAVKDTVSTNDGALAGSATYGAGVGGAPGQGLLLDGGGHVNLGAVPDFGFALETGSVEAWILAEWTSVDAYPCMVANRDGNLTSWSMHMSGNKKVLTFYNGSSSMEYTIPGGGADANWHHVVLVYDTGNATYYWDGAAVGTRSITVSPKSTTVQFGSSASDATAEGWVGMLDEIAVYSVALTPASIQAHYNAFYRAKPEITVQPVGGALLVGQPGQLTVQASGALLRYQWYKNGVAIPGATNSVFGSAAVSTADSGEYYVTVENSFGRADSITALWQVGNNIARYQAAVMSESSLISYYTFDAGDAHDVKGTNAGIVVNATFADGAGAVTNKALILNGGGHVDLGLVPSFEFPGGIGTAEAWIRADWGNASYAPCVFACRDGGSDWSIHMVEAKNAIGNWNNQLYLTLPMANPGGWHHYAVAFGAGKVTMYWDGKSIGTFPQPINIFSGRSTQIGSSAPATTSEGWVGGLDEVAFYSATLGANKILSHYEAMAAVMPVMPKLSYALSGNLLTLSWPGYAMDCILESAGGSNPATWTPVSGVVNNQVTVPTTGPMQLYRLRR